MKLYPPEGGEPSIQNIKSNIEYLLSLGWTTEKPKAVKPKIKEVK